MHFNRQNSLTTIVLLLILTVSAYAPSLQFPITPTPQPSYQLIPDAELIYSPTAIDFDVAAYLDENGGFLNTYEQYLMITGWTSAAEIIQRVALENSINPRLLIALLEYQSGCIIGHPEDVDNFDTAMGAVDYYRKDLYGQLIWAVHVLSEGFYGWQSGTLTEIIYSDGSSFSPPADVNAGSVAIHNFFAQLYDEATCIQALDAINGFPALYEEMFGDPWERAAAIGDLIPDDLTQPELSLPIESGETWALTGGPHKAFENNGPLAALDFAPRTDSSGCVPSDEWVVAMTEGLVVRSEHGTVIQDLDGDGLEQTDWAIMYLHIAEDDRVPVGTTLRAGDFIGHPSCEGGRATGTHTHIARKYNGMWIAADGPYPFVLDGWQAFEGEEAYLGMLTRGEETVTAHQFGSAVSLITRDDDSEQ
ncbi:MAG: hypothetical protein ISR58_08960 [Anaerolineales bacterium]|nr:hypothetical protein [Chloroflexota bacterium]MBL6981307.1 hypothetical protein [Anaerolineales bacterium]